jgi:DNA-binding MarR family transcriptional regulator
MDESRSPEIFQLMNDQDALVRRYTFRIHVLSTLMARMTELSIGQQLALSVPQWRILVYLHGFGQGGVREIAKFHHYTDSQVSRAVQELATQGFVRRLEAEEDRRVAAVELSAKGRRTVEQFLPSVFERNKRLIGAVAPSDRAAFDRGIDAMTKEAQAMLDQMR